MIAAVATNSFARRWLGTWLPEGWTTHWYAAGVEGIPARRRAVGHVEVVFAVVILSIVIGVPAAYTLARAQFPRQARVDAAVPAAADGAADHLRHSDGDRACTRRISRGTLTGVILANLMPALPFVILVMTPFIEQIDPNLESAARVFGAEHGAHVLARAGAAAGAGHPGGVAAGAGAHDRACSS